MSDSIPLDPVEYVREQERKRKAAKRRAFGPISLIGPTWPPKVDVVEALNEAPEDYSPEGGEKKYLTSRKFPVEIRKAIDKLALKVDGRTPNGGVVVDCALSHALDALESSIRYRAFVNGREDAVRRDYDSATVETLVSVVVENMNLKIDTPGRGKRHTSYLLRPRTWAQLDAMSKRLEVHKDDLGLLMLAAVLARQDVLHEKYRNAWIDTVNDFLQFLEIGAKAIESLVALDD